MEFVVHLSTKAKYEIFPSNKRGYTYEPATPYFFPQKASSHKLFRFHFRLSRYTLPIQPITPFHPCHVVLLQQHLTFITQLILVLTTRQPRLILPSKSADAGLTIDLCVSRIYHPLGLLIGSLRAYPRRLERLCCDNGYTGGVGISDGGILRRRSYRPFFIPILLLLLL